MINSPSPPQPPRRGSGPVSPGDSGRTGSEEIKATARHLAEEAKTQGREKLGGARDTAAGSLDRLAESARAAASTLHEDDVGHLSEFVDDMATRMDRLSTSLRTRSGDEILRDVSRMARENPALFISGSIALGFGLARFARASSSKAVQESASEVGTDVRYDSTEGTSTWSPQTGTYDYASGTAPGPTTTHPVNPASSRTDSPGGTQGGIH